MPGELHWVLIYRDVIIKCISVTQFILAHISNVCNYSQAFYFYYFIVIFNVNGFKQSHRVFGLCCWKNEICRKLSSDCVEFNTKSEKKYISLIVLSVSQFWSCTETKQGVCQMSRIIVNISSILFGWLLQTRAAQAERY